MNVDSGQNIGYRNIVPGADDDDSSGVVVFVISIVCKVHSSSVSALRLIGERFFANGTGTAYFDDGPTASFRHTITSVAGYYYDNSTVFAVGEIPGFDINNTITLGITGDIIPVTILMAPNFLVIIQFNQAVSLMQKWAT